MNFKQALKAKKKDIQAEYQMRAARITNWLLEEGRISGEECEDVYNELWNDIAESADEFDELATESVEKVRSRKKNWGGK
jgi:hypothetical protein